MVLAALIREHKFWMFAASPLKNQLRNTIANQRSPAFTAFDRILESAMITDWSLITSLSRCCYPSRVPQKYSKI